MILHKNDNDTSQKSKTQNNPLEMQR